MNGWLCGEGSIVECVDLVTGEKESLFGPEGAYVVAAGVVVFKEVKNTPNGEVLCVVDHLHVFG